MPPRSFCGFRRATTFRRILCRSGFATRYAKIKPMPVDRKVMADHLNEWMKYWDANIRKQQREVSAGSLELERITRRFGTHVAVDDVSFEVPAG